MNFIVTELSLHQKIDSLKDFKVWTYKYNMGFKYEITKCKCSINQKKPQKSKGDERVMWL